MAPSAAAQPHSLDVMPTLSLRAGCQLILAGVVGFMTFIVWVLSTFIWFVPWFFAALMKHPWLDVFTRSEGADDVSVDPWGVRVTTLAIIGMVAAAIFARSRVDRRILWGSLVAGFIAGDFYWGTGYILRGAAGFWDASLYVFVAAVGATLMLTARESR